MYITIILLQTLILPVVSGSIHLAAGGGNPLLVFGIWWAFWGVGTRLVGAGVSQILKPSRTTQGILGITDAGANQIVNELGYANLGMGLLGLAVPSLPEWGIVCAASGAIFMGLAGVRHVMKTGKNIKETVVTWTDLVVLVAVGLGVVGYVVAG